MFKEFLEETIKRVFDPSLNLFKVRINYFLNLTAGFTKYTITAKVEGSSFKAVWITFHFNDGLSSHVK